ncbi:MAG TPA: sulfurtransferase [Bacteroidota bacterium]|nr:sulfurtransferase [Bacteroidota bacterium]
MPAISERKYVHPDVLVSTEWVGQNLQNTGVRLVESNEDTLLYGTGHIPGAVHVDWTSDLNDQVRRDYISRPGFEALMSRCGITPETTVVFYGDKNNWWACYAFWVFQLFGHTRARVMDGGRMKWEKEGKPLTKEISNYPNTSYRARERDDAKIRAFRDDVMKHVSAHRPLVDVRSPEEYTGQRLHMPNYPNEGALRGGHIPGAKNVPWSMAVRPDTGEFKTAGELEAIYLQEAGLKPDQDIVAYCRIGERSSLTWFVLTYLMGFTHVRNYDGSWTEWGNLVNVPIEK